VEGKDESRYISRQHAGVHTTYSGSIIDFF